MDCSTPGFSVHHQLPELAQTQCPSSWWCHPIISSSVIPFFSCLQSFPASWSFALNQFFALGGQSIGPSALVLLMNEYSGLIPFRIDWFDLHAVQGTLKSLFQQHSSKASILWNSAFFMVQLSYPYIQFSNSFVSDCLRAHELQHARPPCPSPTPGVYPNSCQTHWVYTNSLSQWCHPTISSSVFPFSCPQSFPALGSFQMSQLLASGDQSIGVSALTSGLPMNTQDWSPLGWTSWISLHSKGLSRVFSNTTVQKHQFFGAQLSL